MVSENPTKFTELMAWAEASNEAERTRGVAGDRTHQEIEALENLALLGVRSRRAGDRAAYQFFGSGMPPDQGWLDLIKTLPHVSGEMQHKLTRQLVEDGLVALSAMLCETFIYAGNNSKSLIETCSTCLHYLGFSERALHVLKKTNMIDRDKTILGIAVGILIDREAYDAARELIRSSKVDDAVRQTLIGRVDAVDQTITDLSHLTHAAEQGVFVVNLLQDINRRYAVTARLSSLEIRHVVVKAVSIDDIPGHLLPLLRMGTSLSLDGSFGNQLSQYGIWQKIAEGQTSYSIVLEDDAFVRYRGLARLTFDELANDADIIFLNDRLAPSMESNVDGYVGAEPLEDALVRISYTSPNAAALGSDGYVLSRLGAQKLKHTAEIEGFHSVGTDWYLVCHAFDYRRIDELNPDSTMSAVIRAWRSRVQGLGVNRLRGAVLQPAVVEHRPLGTWRSNRVYF